MKNIKDFKNKIIQGDCLEVLKKLPDESIDCVMTSPPYWALRDYGIEGHIWDGNPGCEHKWEETDLLRKATPGDKPSTRSKIAIHRTNAENRPGKPSNFCSKCGAWKGTLGLEPTFELYIKHLCNIFDEVKRVLKKTGTCWVNMGDTYNSAGTNMPRYFDGRSRKNLEHGKPMLMDKTLPEKCLTQAPFRFSIEMVNRGWILRNIIIWWKRNCMPSSIKDRFTVDFDPLFFFVKSNETQYWTNEKTLQITAKQPLGIKGKEGKDWEWRECPNCSLQLGQTKILRENCKRCKGLGKIKYSFWTGHDYWFERQFEQMSEVTKERDHYGYSGAFKGQYKGSPKDKRWQEGKPIKKAEFFSEQGRNKRTVWDICPQPYPEAHFATFPEELCETPIKAGCPEFICKKCGNPREKIYQEEVSFCSGSGKAGNPPKGKNEGQQQTTSGEYDVRMGAKISRKEIGYTNCNCNAGFEPGIVLDPFCGSGTTCFVARKLMRNYIGIELSTEYIKLAEKRLRQQSLFIR